MSTGSQNRMSPRRFAVGFTTVLLISFAFYTWLLYWVLKVQMTWVVGVMTQVALAEVAIGVYGYRLWMNRNYPLSRSASPLPVVSPIRMLLFMGCLAVPAWAAVYLFWRTFIAESLIAALSAALLALWGLTHARAFVPSDSAQLFDDPTAGLLRRPEYQKLVILGIAAYVTFGVGISLIVVENERLIGVIVLLIAALLLLQTIWKLNSVVR